MTLVSRFAEHAESILDAAVCAGESSDLTFVIGAGGIRVFADSDWPLDRVRQHHGADAAYRVTMREGKVRVEGCDGARRCVLESPAR